MKFGVREICDVTFKAKSNIKIGTADFKMGQPVLYIDSAKTSTIEGAATTVYAQGGRGNSRLIAWEGEKTLTFTVEDALLSPIGFAVLSGAGLLNAEDAGETGVMVHNTVKSVIKEGKVDRISDAVTAAPVFVMKLENDGTMGAFISGASVEDGAIKVTGLADGDAVFVDYYSKKTEKVTELQIDAENFAGYYYVEAATLYREESTGKDFPAEITFPKVKIQSNFTFTMASSGDPSTFTFTMDAMPDYTFFDKTKKVLCVMQIIDEDASEKAAPKSVMSIEENEKIAAKDADSTADAE